MIRVVRLNLLLTVWVAGIALAVTGQCQSFGPRSQPAVSLRVGEMAPDFKLMTKEGQRQVQLSGFKGQRPVVLVFGSVT